MQHHMLLDDLTFKQYSRNCEPALQASSISASACACCHQLTPGLRFAFDSGTIQEMIRVDLHQGKSQDLNLIGETDEGQG